VDPQGRLHYFRVLSWPVLDAKDHLACTVVMRRDITQRTFMERRLLQSEKLAAVGELSTFIAHEIRNPLFAIAGFANSLLRSANLDEKSQEKVVIILEEAGRLDQILKSILNFARPTQGKSGQAEVAALASQTMDLMRLCCVKQSVEIRVEVAQGLPMAKGDPELIKQCLINLIKNSLEAMPDGGVLTLRCQMLGDQIALEIEDTGRGIPDVNQDQVFNPFYSTKDKGSGLGLAMTKKILDELGGGVELASQEGKGTLVRLLLPPVLAGMEEDRDPDGPAGAGWGQRGGQ
jgi:signal transduction histidine kinase